MRTDRQVAFGSFRLDPDSACVWHEQQALKVTPKALAVLEYLVTRTGRLVTKAELFKAVWPDTVVSDAALSAVVQELRRTLGDDAKTPQYIETVHRRGYRFIGEVRRQGQSGVRGLEQSGLRTPRPSARRARR